MARKTLFVEQDVSPFTEQKMYGGLYGRVYNFPESGYDNFITDYFIIEPDESYLVEWDGKEYEVVAHDGSSVMDEAVFLGNATMFGFNGNNEPFLIGWIPTGGVFLSTTETTTSHTVAIYQYVSDGIVIKNPNGRSVTYGEYNKLLINRASGEKTIYSMGEAENGTVELDFSKGDITVKPDEGKLWNEVEIAVPEGLVAENIAKGVEIAGVVGMLHIPDKIEKTVELDFTAGDMKVVPDEGLLFSKVDIQKPDTLIPENIVHGVNVAGIIGEHKGGGGAQLDDEFAKYAVYQLDSENMIIYIYGILFEQYYADTGSYDITIPTTIGGYQVVIDSLGVH